MKKALLIGLVLGLVVALAAPALAIDWSARGAFSIKNAVYKNIDYRNVVFLGGVPGSNRVIGVAPTSPPGVVLSGPAYALWGDWDPAWNETSWWLQMRGNILIYARASADLYGVFGIEVNSRRFGDADPTYMNYSGSEGLGKGIAGRWNADAIAIQVKVMLIDFKLPNIPVWIRAGIQPYMIRPATFLYVDAAGLSARTRFGIGDITMQMNAYWAVMRHGIGTYVTANVPTDWTTADDGNLFGIDMSAAIGTVTPGVFFFYQKEGQKYDTATSEGDRDLWWVGLYTTAKFGPVDIVLDGVFNGGWDDRQAGIIAIQDPSNPFNLGVVDLRTSSVKHEAWLIRGDVSFTVNKFKFGVGGLYGSGDNFSTRGKYEGYMLPYRSEAAKFNADFLVVTGDWGLRQTYGSDNVGGMFKAWSNVGQGVWYVRGYADFAVTDWLKLKTNFGYIGDTCKGYYAGLGGDEFGTDMEDDDSIGWEIDAGIQIDIYKNLTLDTAFGYLIAGKAIAGQYGGNRAQDPWALMTVLNYSF